MEYSGRCTRAGRSTEFQGYENGTAGQPLTDTATVVRILVSLGPRTVEVALHVSGIREPVERLNAVWLV